MGVFAAVGDVLVLRDLQGTAGVLDADLGTVPLDQGVHLVTARSCRLTLPQELLQQRRGGRENADKQRVEKGEECE